MLCVTTWTRRIAATVAIALMAVPAAASAEPTPDVAYPDDPQLQRAYESGFYRGSDAGYLDGRDEGYDDGYEAGLAQGAAQARAEAERDRLRDDVEKQIEEGGADLGSDLPTPTPTPTASPSSGGASPAVTMPPDESDDRPGVPWWPLAFAVAATAWFVTRRRRADAADQERGGHELG